MLINNCSVVLFKQGNILFTFKCNESFKKLYHGMPFLNLYKKAMGQPLCADTFSILKKRHPNLENVSQEHIDYTLKILRKFDISATDACRDPHVFSMNPISMDNYGEILRECGFIKIVPKYIIRYHTIVRSKTISYLKKEGLLKNNLNLEEKLLNCFKDWPENQKCLTKFSDSTTSILTVRTSVLGKYLKWRLSVTEDEFMKYCRNYLPLRHRPMSDIKEALNIAQNDIKFDNYSIRRNGFIISSDPINTKLIIENVKTLAGYDIREAIRIEPAILKNNYNSLLEIQKILQTYNISEEAQKHCLRVYCMSSETVQARLDQLKDLKEYQILSTNPRVLSMVIHQRKMFSRLEKIQSAKKQCYSLNHLLSSNKVFHNYINSFGNKVCGRDIAVLITSSIHLKKDWNNTSIKKGEQKQADLKKTVLKQLRRHKYWLHSSLYIINENIQYLNKNFYGEVIVNNCQIVLYPIAETEKYLEFFLKQRNCNNEVKNTVIDLDGGYNNLNYSVLTDDQILSLVMYEIEKKYHFTGDGIWNRQDGSKEQQAVNQQMLRN